MAEAVVVADGVFTWPAEEPRLVASRCRSCGLVSFPVSSPCLRCAGSDVADLLLSPAGTLWTFTTQGFRPPSPPYDGTDGAGGGDGDGTSSAFMPYAVGCVEFPEGIVVEGRLTEPDPARLRIGQPMRVAVVPYTRDADGRDVLTFAFAPEAGKGHG